MKKEELELKKLKLEVENLSREKWKFFFGFIPIITLLVTAILTLYKLDLAEKKDKIARSDKRKEFYQKLYFSTTNLETRMEIANSACNDSIIDAPTKKDYCEKENALKKQIEITNESNDIIDDNSNNVNEEVKNKMIALEKEIEDLKEKNKTFNKKDNQENYEKNSSEIISLNQELDSIIQSNEFVQESVNVADTLEKKINIELETPKTTPLKNQLLFEEESWFKEKYYREFGETRVSLKKLTKRSKVATIDIKVGPDKIGTLNIKEGKKDSITHQGFIYEITFLRIGKAGKNPFTNAVFFKYRKYIK